MIDYKRLLDKLTPPPDGEDYLRMRVGVVDAIGADGHVDVGISGVVIPDVPVLGSATFAVGSSVQILSYRGSLLVLGAGGITTSQAFESLTANSNSGNATSTGGTNTLTGSNGGIHGVAFIAPASGQVHVIGRCSAGNNAAGGFTLLDFEVKIGATIGSGTTFRGPSDVSSSSFESAVANQFGSHTTSGLVTGLTPGSTYNAALVYKISGGTSSSWNRRYISVDPR